MGLKPDKVGKGRGFHLDQVSETRSVRSVG